MQHAGNPNHSTCPECGATIPPMKEGATGAACPNPECRTIVDASLKAIGRFTEGYVEPVYSAVANKGIHEQREWPEGVMGSSSTA